MNEVLTAYCEVVNSNASNDVRNRSLLPLILPGSSLQPNCTISVDETVVLDLGCLDAKLIDKTTIEDSLRELEIDLIGEVNRALERPLLRKIKEYSLAEMNRFTTFDLKTFLRGAFRMAECNVKDGIMLVSFDVWTDILTNPDFAGRVTVASNEERMKVGFLGRLDLWDIYTDAYRFDGHRNIPYGTWFMIPKNLGTMSGDMCFSALMATPVNHKGVFSLKYKFTFTDKSLYGGVRTPQENEQ